MAFSVASIGLIRISGKNSRMELTIERELTGIEALLGRNERS
jgi:hypothetical protein